jgi:hypothetical protein
MEGIAMKNKKMALVPLATALASLSTTAADAKVGVVPTPDPTASSAEQSAHLNGVQANTLFNAGEDLLGLLTTTNANGTVVAQHVSHASHSSHSSHTSSRY